MELVDGPTLADLIASGPPGVDDALKIARQIAEALESAHAQGIVHRDLRPANIKVRPDDVDG
jgi:eukaryotic-like serine/threonine-protein kinase